MKVILIKDFAELGKVGDTREVKDGYASNFLIPKGIAAPLNSVKAKSLLAKISAKIEASGRKIEEAAAVAKGLDGKKYQVRAKIGSLGKLFGSISKSDIAKLVNVEKEAVNLADPIKSVGIHKVQIALARGATATVLIEVVPE